MCPFSCSRAGLRAVLHSIVNIVLIVFINNSGGQFYVTPPCCGRCESHSGRRYYHRTVSFIFLKLYSQLLCSLLSVYSSVNLSSAECVLCLFRSDVAECSSLSCDAEHGTARAELSACVSAFFMHRRCCVFEELIIVVIIKKKKSSLAFLKMCSGVFVVKHKKRVSTERDCVSFYGNKEEESQSFL